MYNKQLDTFLMTVEKKTFSKAAEALYITPSAVIQQINHLENDLQVKLFTRTRHGLSLTSAGEFLLQESNELISHSKYIRQRLLEIARKGQNEIRIGTGLLQKTRLFYELWMQFQGEQKGYSVCIQNLDAHLSERDQVDIIEGILDGETWQKGLNFLQLCTVPIACAVPLNHPLAEKKLITYDDMRSTTLITIHSGMCETLDQLITDTVSRGIHVLEVPQYDLSVFGMCLMNGYLLQTPFCWRDIHPSLVTIPCEWEYFLPYGIHYKKTAETPVLEFLQFVQEYIKDHPMSFY